jgi:hypothetical protein
MRELCATGTLAFWLDDPPAFVVCRLALERNNCPLVVSLLYRQMLHLIAVRRRLEAELSRCIRRKAVNSYRAYFGAWELSRCLLWILPIWAISPPSDWHVKKQKWCHIFAGSWNTRDSRYVFQVSMDAVENCLPFVADGMITCRVQRSAYSLIPISSRLNTGSTQTWWTRSRNPSSPAWRKTRGTSSLGFSCGTLLVSKSCSACASEMSQPILLWYSSRISHCIRVWVQLDWSLRYLPPWRLFSPRAVALRLRQVHDATLGPEDRRSPEAAHASLLNGQFQTRVQRLWLIRWYAVRWSQTQSARQFHAPGSGHS